MDFGDSREEAAFRGRLREWVRANNPGLPASSTSDAYWAVFGQIPPPILKFKWANVRRALNALGVRQVESVIGPEPDTPAFAQFLQSLQPPPPPLGLGALPPSGPPGMTAQVGGAAVLPPPPMMPPGGLRNGG